MSKSVRAEITVHLSDETVDRLFRSILDGMKEGRWIAQKMGSDPVVMEEFSGGHKSYDDEVGKAADPKYDLLRAVTELERVMRDRSLRPSRFIR
jgi:hypothetical protein